MRCRRPATRAAATQDGEGSGKEAEGATRRTHGGGDVDGRVTGGRLGLGVAFIIVSLVPLRAQLLPYVFTADELAALD